MIKAFIVIIFLLSLLFVVGCSNRDIVFIDKDVCKQPGTYCHVYIVDGGTVNISFPSVVNGTFNYSVEGV